MPNRERLITGIQPELREEDGAAPVLHGVASVAYDGTERTEFVLREADPKLGVRRVVERILPGAFDKVLKSKKTDVRVLRNHNPDNLLGRTKSGTARVFTDANDNLAYETELPDTTMGRDTREQLRRGDLSGSSFAFTIGDETFKDEGEVRAVEIKRVEALYDVGPVTYPAYSSTAAGVRSGDPSEVLKRMEAWEAEQDKVNELETAEAVKAAEAKRAEYEERARKAGA